MLVVVDVLRNYKEVQIVHLDEFEWGWRPSGNLCMRFARVFGVRHAQLDLKFDLLLVLSYSKKGGRLKLDINLPYNPLYVDALADQVRRCFLPRRR